MCTFDEIRTRVWCCYNRVVVYESRGERTFRGLYISVAFDEKQTVIGRIFTVKGWLVALGGMITVSKFDIETVMFVHRHENAKIQAIDELEHVHSRSRRRYNNTHHYRLHKIKKQCKQTKQNTRSYFYLMHGLGIFFISKEEISDTLKNLWTWALMLQPFSSKL